MKILNLTENSYESAVTSDGIVVVDCWAQWCKACKDFKPIFEEVAGRHPEHTFAKIDTQDEKSLVSALGIEHIPTLMLFRDGQLLLMQPGYMDLAGLEDVVAQAESVDMDAVRAHIASEQAAAGQ